MESGVALERSTAKDAWQERKDEFMTVRRASSWSFILGLASSVAYLAAGGSTFWSVPLWASILFYTGFFTGTMVQFSFGPTYNAPEIIGCLTVAMTYALLFGLISKVIEILWKRLHRGPSSDCTPREASGKDGRDATNPARA